jgi:glycosyltransferase involved in cell wall biosynthesis
MSRISVVIPTYQREKVLQDTIHQLVRQRSLPDELIIIDQGSEKNVQASITLLQECGIKCSYLYSKYRSPGSSRNIGISVASSPVVLFIDDDVELVTDIVGVHSSYYRNEPHLGGVAGHILPKHLYSEKYISWNTFAPTGKYVREARGGNMSFSLDVLRRIGGFNAFLKNTGEEGELCHRVIRAGYKIMNGKEAIVKHLSAPGGTRALDNHSVMLDRVRDMVISVVTRRSLWAASLWPLKNLKSVWKTVRSAPSVVPGIGVFVKHYLLGLRYGMYARGIQDYLPLSLRLAQGQGLDVRTGLPVLHDWRRSLE